MATIAAYGSWESPIAAEELARNETRFTQVGLDGDTVYWVESHPTEGGRNALMALSSDGSIREKSSPDMNVRTRVHEYGGGACVLDHGVIAYVNYGDQVLYLVDSDEFRPLTTEGMRYADGIVDASRKRIICVREDHTGDGEAVNTIVSVQLDTRGPGEVLVSGHDFYTTPRLSPDGHSLSWVAYNHPQMPWTRSQLWIADVLDDGTLSDTRCLVDGDESVFQPSWSPDNQLYFVSDRSGWWNLYRWDVDHEVPLKPMDAEFGRPQWVFGVPTYGFRDAENIVCSYTMDGAWHLAMLDLRSGALDEIEQPYTSIADVHVDAERVVFEGAAPDKPDSIVEYRFDAGECRTLKKSSDYTIEPGYLSIPEAIPYPTTDGARAHAFYYAPHNQDYQAPEGDKPPLIVISHGGPTSATSSSMKLGIQYWSSRGYAVLDVNYGGSTGYGREYMQRLDDNWGIVDVDDCIAGAQYLAESGRVDGERMVIRGGSAGGFTTLAALTFRDVFKAGASYYGVSDLGALARETHKFESRYLDGLVGPYPERKDIYDTRSALMHVDQLSCPIIFFQGLEDKVVLPNQAEMMVDALREKGIPVAYLAYKGEQHGFRKAENIARSLTAEQYFYAKVLGIPAPQDIEPVEIENLPEAE